MVFRKLRKPQPELSLNKCKERVQSSITRQLIQRTEELYMTLRHKLKKHYEFIPAMTDHFPEFTQILLNAEQQDYATFSMLEIREASLYALAKAIVVRDLISPLLPIQNREDKVVNNIFFEFQTGLQQVMMFAVEELLTASIDYALDLKEKGLNRPKEAHDHPEIKLEAVDRETGWEELHLIPDDQLKQQLREIHAEDEEAEELPEET